MANAFLPLFISYALFLTNVISPQLGFVVTFLSPIFLIHYLKGEFRTKNSDIISAIAVLSTAVYDPLIPMYFVLIVVVPTVLIKLHYDNRLQFDAIVASGIPLLIGSTLLLFFLPEYRNTLIENIINYLELVTKNISPDFLLSDQGSKLVFLKNNSTLIATMIVHLLPGMSYAYVTLIAFSTNRFYFKKYEMTPLIFNLPDRLFPALLFGGFFIIIQGNWAQTISFNTLIIFAALFFVQGLEVLNSLLNKYKLSIFVRMIVYILIFSEPPVMIVVCLVGLADNWLDLVTKLQAKTETDDGNP